jgi:hypothetical protein
MNTNRATVFLIALCLSGGCASVAPEDSDCEGAKLRQITIVYQRNSKITVSPPKKDVDRGDAINYKVRGPEARPFKAKGTKAPNASASFAWLDATGSGDPSGRSHIVCVPADQATGNYEYVIEIEGVGTLDPVVRVN